MNGWPDVEDTLHQFRQWLTQTAAEAQSSEAVGEPAEAPALSPTVGLLQLVREFTALRHELKLQTKSARGLEEQTAAALAGLAEASTQFRGVPAQEEQAAERAAAPLVQALAELDEALQRGQAGMDFVRRQVVDESAPALQRQLQELWAGQAWWKRWWCGRWQRAACELVCRQAEVQRQGLDSLREGYGLIRDRLQKALLRAEVRRIECCGRPVDPHTMTIIEVVDDPSRPAGTVVDEIRPGYFWKGQVFRCAEVRAVRERPVGDFPAPAGTGSGPAAAE
jgi:molecular chaperone GrpE